MGTGIKQRDLKPCCVCGKGVAHDRQLVCTRLLVSRMAVNVGAARRQTGLEMMLGGAAMLASVMGPDEDILVQLGDQDLVMVCDNCSIRTSIAEIWERLGAAEKKAAEAAEASPA